MAKSDTDIKDFCKRKLGYPVVGVELSDDQIGDALEESKEVFQGYIGQQKVHVISGVSAGGAFDMPSDCEDVVDVAFALNASGLFDQFNWAGVELGPLSFGLYGGYNLDGGGVGGGYSYLVQALQYRELAKEVLSVDRDWTWDRAQRKLLIFPTEGDVGSKALTRYLVDSLDVSLLRSYEYGLLRRYTFAECCETLAQVRTKYADLPSATGTLSLNGDTLFSNAETIKMNVEDKLKLLRAPAPFFAA